MKGQGKIWVATLAVCLAVSAAAEAVADELLPAVAAEETVEVKKADVGFTAGFGVGGAVFDKFNSSTFAWRVQGAYAPCRWFAAELEWLDLGNPNHTFSGTNVEMDVGGFNLSAMPMLPIGEDWTFFGKLGGYFWDAHFAGNSGGDWAQDMTYGAGVMYNNVIRSLGIGLKAEWTRADLEIEKQTSYNPVWGGTKEHVDIFTVGAFYHF